MWTLLLVLGSIGSAVSVHISGSWDSRNFFVILTKFGFQQTDSLGLERSRGFVYGNVSGSGSGRVLMVLTSRSYFPGLYQGMTGRSCASMLKQISRVAFDHRCLGQGKQDFFRWVPCPPNGLCPDEDLADNVIPGFQFTYETQNLFSAGFWYLAFVACDLDAACNWTSTVDSPVVLHYDIWLVNGHPLVKTSNPFEHQFSFDEQDTVEIYLVAFCVHFCLLLLQWRALSISRQEPPVRGKFLLSIIALKTLGISFNLVHIFIFSFNGRGVLGFRWTGDLLNLGSGGLFQLLILLLARGWSISSVHVQSPVCVFALWALSLLIHVSFFIWNSEAVDPLEEIDIFETWPGWGILLLRVLLLIWFLFEIRRSVNKELDPAKGDFLIHFGAGFLVWFAYLPTLGVLASHISLLWRFKVILGLLFLADFVAMSILVHLFWPRSTNRKFFKDQQETLLTTQDELEEYEQDLLSPGLTPTDPYPPTSAASTSF